MTEKEELTVRDYFVVTQETRGELEDFFRGNIAGVPISEIKDGERIQYYRYDHTDEEGYIIEHDTIDCVYEFLDRKTASIPTNGDPIYCDITCDDDGNKIYVPFEATYDEHTGKQWVFDETLNEILL